LESLIGAKVARLLYGVLFVVAVPAALALWAHGARGAVHLTALHSVFWGEMLVGFGVLIMALGMAWLWRRGGGLPMNAFPPPRFVESGIYALVPHPIYGGFVIAFAGVAVATGSASGLWLVMPCAAMGCAALVLGYELPDLRARFGARKSSLWLPCERADAPSPMERMRVYLVVLLPWLALFELMGALGAQPDAVTSYLPFEWRIPVIEQTELLYASTYLVVLLTPLMAVSGHALRRFAMRGLIAMAFLFPLYLVLPFFVPPRPFHPSTAIGGLLLWERTPFSGIAAFPSFHMVWACIAASALGEGGGVKRIIWWTWAVLVTASCVTTGMHSIADVAAGVVVFVLVARAGAIWAAMLRGGECIANSWKEWRLGPMRIINHGAYAGAGALVGMAMVDSLLGPGREWITASIFLCSITGAALWAQWVEGSPKLLRPMGYYGGVIGAMIGGLPAFLFRFDVWTAIAAIAVAAPWIQGLGRLRCLVQGCCHGRAAESVPGIRYTHPRTRVCRLANLGGVPIHATQIYSIAWNLFVGAALLRLLTLHGSTTMICGIYLLLSGFGRFVEEAYRGEPQTMSLGGLHLYQWIAITTCIAGASLTCLPGLPMPPMTALRMSTVLISIGCGAVAWFVTGMDFPESSRRFARLT